ncbi:hypothetical protein TWF173_002058 [Orbilia oligospora]|nr:hypothetical protein TWF173_002058 [Orbilia oligospora]
MYHHRKEIDVSILELPAADAVEPPEALRHLSPTEIKFDQKIDSKFSETPKLCDRVFIHHQNKCQEYYEMGRSDYRSWIAWCFCCCDSFHDYHFCDTSVAVCNIILAIWGSQKDKMKELGLPVEYTDLIIWSQGAVVDPILGIVNRDHQFVYKMFCNGTMDAFLDDIKEGLLETLDPEQETNNFELILEYPDI